MSLAKVFESDRLIYEPLDLKNEETTSFIYTNTMLDPEVNGYTTLHTFRPPTKGTCVENMQHWAGNYLSVVVCLKPEIGDKIDSNKSLRGTPIGYMVIYPIPQARMQHRSGSFGISIATQYQGKGYGTEALKWLVDWSFLFGNLHSLRLQTGTMNPKAIGVYTKVGFVVEGREREAIYLNGEWHDIISMSILDQEWRVMRQDKGGLQHS